ncbi:hypothetical protein [Alteripontixanthobacter muriae]|nr:hypothetical protein [Alteripontixanthobacter muriae]
MLARQQGETVFAAPLRRCCGTGIGSGERLAFGAGETIFGGIIA